VVVATSGLVSACSCTSKDIIIMSGSVGIRRYERRRLVYN
jgi:hypothetical protein